MPALITGLLLGLAVLLHGAWEPEFRAAFFLAAMPALAAWVSAGLLRGAPRLPRPAAAAWLCALALLGGLSALASPLPAAAFPAWRSQILGLVAFAMGSLLRAEERLDADRALRLCAWGLLILGFVVPWSSGRVPRPGAALGNENILAGMILLLLPSALIGRDWILTAGLGWLLVWTGSAGAWLGVAVAAAIAVREKAAGRWLLPAAVLAFAAVFAFKFSLYGASGPEKLGDRLRWWEAAWRLARERPWLGFGPGSYAFAAASDAGWAGIWKSRFAHQGFLEAAVENGFPFAALLFGGLFARLRRPVSGAPWWRRLGAWAVLIESLVDYPLSIPAGFWLFCYLAGAADAVPAAKIEIPGIWRRPAAAAVLGLAVLACLPALDRLRADRLRERAADVLHEAGGPARALELLRRSAELADDPETERDMALIVLSGLRDRRAGGLRAGAVYLARAAKLDPFRRSTKTMLANVERDLGGAGR